MGVVGVNTRRGEWVLWAWTCRINVARRGEWVLWAWTRGGESGCCGHGHARLMRRGGEGCEHGLAWLL